MKNVRKDKYQKSETILLFVVLAFVVPAGFYTKFYYRGIGQTWAANHGAAIFYEIFWVIVLRLCLRRLSPVAIAVWVLVVTCLLEILQLWHPAWLGIIRENFLGAVMLGTTFSWLDFPHYVIGCFFGYIMINKIKKV